MLLLVLLRQKAWASWEEVLWESVCRPELKWSTRRSRLVDLQCALTRKGLWSPSVKSACRRISKVIDLALLREVPAKALILQRPQLEQLCSVSDPMFAVPLALMLPTGARYADVERIQKEDITAIEANRWTLRVYQAKNIRSRKHQRYLTMVIPQSLHPILLDRYLSARFGDPLVQTTYRQFLAFVKRLLGKQYSTYSIRRGVFEQLRTRVNNIDEFTKVTFHRSQEQLRWYLEAPLPDETRIQVAASSWHL